MNKNFVLVFKQTEYYDKTYTFDSVILVEGNVIITNNQLNGNILTKGAIMDVNSDFLSPFCDTEKHIISLDNLFYDINEFIYLRIPSNFLSHFLFLLKYCLLVYLMSLFVFLLS